MFGIDPSFFSSLAQVILIDLVLAGDNAVVIGLAAAGLASDVRKRAILIGILAATVLRIFFALITTQLLSLGGGLLVAGELPGYPVVGELVPARADGVTLEVR